jgi:hypothetical protein
VLTLALAALLAVSAGPFDSLKFLQGEWIGEGGGEPGQASSSDYSFLPELDGKILVRRSRSSYPAAKDRPAFVHQDLLVVYPGAPGKPPHAIYWDNEGHMIQYEVAADGKSAAFVSQSDGAGPRYRLTYKSTGPDKVSIRFEVAAPGKPFQVYVEGTARKKQ